MILSLEQEVLIGNKTGERQQEF
uniref:Uncharacterized protein n=1 Tax=Rhizophora mucronata TaxID=61149 RepID=A0A2P2NF52_RHIMU